jgi:endonuclease YncB( thermonuclease family)
MNHPTSIHHDVLARCTLANTPKYEMPRPRDGLVKIVKAYDGDTVTLAACFGDGMFAWFDCRIAGIDSPEMKPPLSTPDRALTVSRAVAARNRIIQLGTDCDVALDDSRSAKALQPTLDSNRKIIQAHVHGIDKYGRVLCSLYDGGVDLAEKMIQEGHAYAYDGGTKLRVA